ncbi:MAG: HAMP domain-containing sensor histidine kinase [Pedobacter sp.]|jgi:signal transduction histidine kinase|uniref:sensor histidine kinase n=1 Tax=Pedobacter sp. TaxID=1411316 RepID=UPI003398EBCE
MNLLNYTLKYLYITLLIVISLWAVIFYFRMIDEIEDSLDDGLENDKMLVIQKVAHDKATITRAGFSEHNYSIRPLNIQPAQEIKDNYKDTMMYTLNEKDLEPFRLLTTAFRSDNSYYELKVVASTLEQDDLVRSLLYSLVGLYAAILISILVINNALLRKIWIPFYQLLSRLKDFRLDKDIRIETMTTDIKEFAELNLTVKALVQQSVTAYGSQKQFIENAAHELQTPIAISLNRLELLAEDNTLSETNMESVGKVITTLQRLARLNRTLLIISKIENKQYGSEETLAINGLVKTMIAEYRYFADAKHVTLKYKNEGTLSAVMNKDLAAILISNLLKNAVNHNIPDGAVSITVNSSSIIFANSGKTVPLDHEQIFERFSKDSNSKNSTGLGLAIVKSITSLYGFKLLYSYPGQHQFEVIMKP